MVEIARVVQKRSQAEIEEMAWQARNALGLRPFDRVPVAEVMENMLHRLLPEAEIRVLEDHNLSGAEAITHQSLPIITFSNTTYTGMYQDQRRPRMTAIHELGHLLLHCGGQVGYAFMRRPEVRIDPEWQANIFMAAFMMPECAFRRVKSIKQAMKVFGVSRDAACCRARSLGMHGLVWEKFHAKPTKNKGHGMHRTP